MRVHAHTCTYAHNMQARMYAHTYVRTYVHTYVCVQTHFVCQI